ncbi:glutamine--fructose-6-phosphate transaminase (isomerizing) [Butyricicoccus sp.]|uniref:glutamine--fructose-6-phosphate transaminase (isomerizing) n=1 Tax=Butyricicoccus sp. TaxID=2049021 RepID=UPI003F13CCC4
MCGIVGYAGYQPAAPFLLEGLQKLEYRGYDSAGIAVFSDKVRTMKSQGRLATLREKVDAAGGIPGTLGIGHTRWATHGAPNDINSHPHSSMTGRITVVHNGIIENYIPLKEELQAEGVVFRSETDTEVVAQLFDKLYDGDLVGTLIQVVGKIRGSYALGILCKDYPDTLLAVRKDSPMIIGLGEHENYIASDIPAVLDHTRNYYLLNDNEIAIIKADSVELVDLDRNPIHHDVYTVDYDISAAEKGGYDYFMMKEIKEQPNALRTCIGSRIQNGEIQLDKIRLTEEQIQNMGRIHIVACGSAWHAAMVGKYVIEELTRIPVEVDLASEFRYRRPILKPNDLCITISQSGETADTLAALREARANNVHVLSIVNAVGSSIARESDDVLYTMAGPEIAVATTKGYTTQLAVLYLVALKFGMIRNTVPAKLAEKLLHDLEALPDQLESLFQDEEALKQLAKDHQSRGTEKTRNNVFIIGRGIDYGASLESSLKLKEISYVHSEAYAAGELKHGTISLIEEGTLVVAVATQKPLYEKLISNVKEVKARGAYVVAIVREGCTDVESVADQVFYIPNTSDLFTSTLTVVPMQLFAYYTAIELGCDVDKPRNLAKSVTVE